MWRLCVCLLLVSTPAWATTYYVSKTASNGYAVGSNSNSCAQAQNKATPKAEPGGASGASNCLASGDTLLVNEGTYTAEILNPAGGTALAYTTIKADPASTRPVLEPDGAGLKRGLYCTNGAACSYIRFEGFEVKNAYNSIKLATTSSTIGYPHHVQIVNNILHDTEIANIETNTSNTGGVGGDHLFQGNEFYNTGIHNPLYAPGYNTIYNPGSRSVVEKNIFHNLHNGVGIWTSNKYLYDVIVRDNYFYDIGLTSTDTWQAGAGGYSCIHISSSGGGHQIYNNVCRTSGETSNFRGINIIPQFGATTLTGIVIYNNTIYDLKHASAYGIRVAAQMQTPSGVTAKNNLVIPVLGTAISDASGVSALVQVSNRTTGTPSALFTNPGAGDVSLAAGSAAIDAGTSCTNASNGPSCDQGAYETPAFASCEVKFGEPTRVYFRFTNNHRPPMLPASGVTGVTFRRNAANNVATSFAKTSDNEYYAVITDSQSAGEAIDLSIVSSNLTDSALIGNSLNQPFVATVTNQSCTNSLAGAPSYTLTQARYEHRSWRGLEPSPVILPHGFASTGAAENFSNIKVRPRGMIRTRFAILCGVANCSSSSFLPYFSTGGAYGAVTGDFTVNNIKMCGALTGTDVPQNGTATTEQLSTAGTFVAGGIIFTANDVPEITGLDTGYKTELEYCFEFDSDASGNFDIRLYSGSGAALDTYTVTPRYVIEPAAAGGM